MISDNCFYIHEATDAQIEAWMYATPRVRAAVRGAEMGRMIDVDGFTTTERRWVATILGFTDAPGYLDWLTA